MIKISFITNAELNPEFKKVFLNIFYYFFDKEEYAFSFNKRENQNYYFYLNFPLTKEFEIIKKKSFLFIGEPKTVYLENFKKKNYDFFSKIFTWEKDKVDNKKIFYFNYYFPKKSSNFKIKEKRKKFCCAISGNKFSFNKKELYSKRRKFYLFLERKKVDFDLYGFGWNKFFMPFKSNLNILKIINYFYLILFSNHFKSFKGPIKNKESILKEYNFSICFENGFNDAFYITEKIWDSLSCGCIPIYLGSTNIQEIVPKNCFIDFRDFKNEKECYEFISSLTEADIIDFRQNIKNFLTEENVFNIIRESMMNIKRNLK